MMKICIFFGDMQTGINTQSIRFLSYSEEETSFSCSDSGSEQAVVKLQVLSYPSRFLKCLYNNTEPPQMQVKCTLFLFFFQIMDISKTSGRRTGNTDSVRKKAFQLRCHTPFQTGNRLETGCFQVQSQKYLRFFYFPA